MTEKRDNVPVYRWVWDDPSYVPYTYLPKKKFEEKIAKLLVRDLCTPETHARWLRLYRERARARRSKTMRDTSVKVLWGPILDAFDREIAGCNSSLQYYRMKQAANQRESFDYQPHIDANLYYREVLRDTRKRINAFFIKTGVTPKEAAERLGRANTDWYQFVPMNKREHVRTDFSALIGRGTRHKLPFAITFDEGETSHRKGDANNEDDLEPPKYE